MGYISLIFMSRSRSQCTRRHRLYYHNELASAPSYVSGVMESLTERVYYQFTPESASERISGTEFTTVTGENKRVQFL